VLGFSAAELSKGDVTIVNFWASWCAPCVAEHPLLVELAENSGVKLYGVNYKDKPEAARRFLGRYGNPFAAMGVDPQGRGAIEWGVYGMPETFVINGRGEIAYKHVGPITHQSMRDNLLPALKAAAAAPGSVAAQ
jgi:cytochrome c biogenesis protein CcmG/thiol:disulfide interchange protein DsbE